jgi:predicted RND superfamily exporter protein
MSISKQDRFAGIIEQYEALVLDRPVLSLFLLGVMLVMFALYIPKFELDVSADSLVLENDADLEYYRNIRARYGSDDYLIITYTADGNLFSGENLQHIRELRDRIQAIEGIESVASILDVPLLESPPISLNELRDGAPTLEQATTDVELARQELQTSPLYRNRLLSADGGTCAIQVNLSRDEAYHQLRQQRNALREKKLSGELTAAELKQLNEVSEKFDLVSKRVMDSEQEVIRQVRKIMAGFQQYAELHLGGVPMIVSDMMGFIRHDLVVFGLGVLGILAVMLAIVFRQLRFVILPLLTAAAVSLVTLGFLGMVGWPVTVVSSNFLALVLIFSLSLIIHLIVRYRELHLQKPDAEQRWLVSATLRAKAAPCFFTVLTTMVAFASLVVSGIRPVIDFGWIMVFALSASMFLSFSLFPSMLMLMQPGKPQQGKDITGLIMMTFARLVDHHDRKLLIFAGLLLVLGVAGVSRLTVENRFIDYFHSSTEIYQGMKLIDEKLGGTTPLDVIIDAPVEEPSEEEWEEDPLFEDDYADAGITSSSYWFNTYMLEEIGAIHQYLDELPETGKVLSLDTTNRILDKLDEQKMLDDFFLSLVHKRMPEEIKSQVINPYLSDDGQQTRFSIRVYESDTQLNRKELLNKIRTYLGTEREQYGEQVHLSGMVVLYNNLLQSLFYSQIQTLGFVFLVIMLTFAIVFRSFKVAFIAIIPNILPAILVLGALGGLGIPLDIMTITIAAIAVGISVDDTIHYIYRYHNEWKKDGDYRSAMFRSHNSIGRAMYYTTMTITIGFIVMVLSNFIPTVYFGLFTAFAMISALLANVTILAALMRIVKPY